MADRPARRQPAGGGKVRKRKNTFAVFYIITMLIGVVVCITLFALAYQTLVPDRIMAGNPPSADESGQPEFVRLDHDRVLGMVTAMETFGHRVMTVHLLDSGRASRFNMTDTTTVTDRRGNPIAFGEINLGQIVEIDFNASTMDMSSVALSGRAWEQTHRGNFIIDLEAATLTIGNQVYSYSSRTLVLSNNEHFSIGLINPEDTITIVGYDDKIWSIRIEGGHGFIRFANAERIVNGTITIGNSVFVTLEDLDNQPVSVMEGTHRVIVNGQNIETFMADVVVRQGQTVVVDLTADMTLRHGTLQLILNEPTADIFINGEQVELENTTVQLEFGTHLLRAEAAGFIPIQEEIVMEQPFMQIELMLARDESAAQILIETFPSDAQIFLNHAYMGNSPITIEVEFGANSIIARRAGYEDQTLNIMVDAASPRQYLLHLVQLPMHLPPFENQPGFNNNYLPPPPPDVTPIPNQQIPPDWPPPPPPPPPPPLPPQQPQQPDWPPPPPQDDEFPDWPPRPEDLPFPPGYDLPLAPGYMYE